MGFFVLLNGEYEKLIPTLDAITRAKIFEQ
jgi:hypothetical protein